MAFADASSRPALTVACAIFMSMLKSKDGIGIVFSSASHSSEGPPYSLKSHILLGYRSSKY